MKNKLIILLLLLTTWQANAQKDDYIHLLDTNKLWIEAMMMEFGEIFVYENYIGERIVYNDTVYYELFTGFKSPYYLREDTIEYKVYGSGIYPGGEDGLLYDFSLQVGDSIDLGSGYLYVDSINLIDNKYRTLYLGEPGWEGQLIWSEGIGSLAGILQNRSTPGLYGMGQTELNCLYQNDELLYQSYWASLYGCHFEHLSIEDKDTQEINLLPNPVNNISRLEFINIENKQVELRIYNILGKLIYSNQTISDFFEISKTNFNSGVYIYTISKNNQIFYSNKLIIQ